MPLTAPLKYPRTIAVLMVMSGLVLIVSVLAFVTEIDSGWISIPLGLVLLPIFSLSYSYFDRQSESPCTERQSVDSIDTA
jgi:hypothetical protein